MFWNEQLVSQSSGRRLLQGTLAAVMAMGPGFAGASLSTLDEIRQVAADHALHRAAPAQSERVSVQVGNLDPRLRLAACTAGMEAFDPQGARKMGSTLVGVRCLGPTRWSVYVSANVTLEIDVLVASRSLQRGQPISASAVRLETRRVGNLRAGYYTALDQVHGMLAKRNLTPGTILSPRLIKAPRLVRRGDRVTLLIKAGQITVSALGESNADGIYGQIIPVENAKTGKKMRGRVLAKGRVEVLL